MSNTKGTSVISNPQGGGAQSGLGEKFSPDLFTGTGNFSVPIALPPGRNGFQPELTLGYSSGNGNGVFGMGWALGVPGVMRKTSKGIPVYNDKIDVFILSGAEDLVPVAFTQSFDSGVSWEQTTYKPRTEGLFARIIRHKKSNGEHYWEVRSKDGLVSWYGTPGAEALEAPSGDPAVTANPENRNAIFSWNLTKTEDPFGNVILYNYTRDLVVNAKGRSYDQVYLDSIQYAQYPDGAAVKYLCKVQFNYEDRPDPFSGYKQGFETRCTKRCISIETYTNAASLIKTKTYHFNYQSNLPLNGASLLQSVSVEGYNGDESEFMPPLEFRFSVFDPTKRELQDISGPIPFAALSDKGYELVDLDGNGLPDILQLNGTARYWANKGNGKFGPPRNLDLSPSVQLGTPGVQFLDANGDGRTDLFVNNGTTAGYFPGTFHKVWDDKSFRTCQNIPSFSFADPEVQLIDLDGDGITDVLRNGAKFECFYNDPVKGFYKVRTAEKTFANFSFADPRIRFADMTGDGLQDIVLISSGRVQYWPNMGYGRFGNKVNMSNAPVFPEQYDPAQVLLGDLDGDGQSDIAFVENNSVTLYVNQSGNGFSAPVKIRNTPRVADPKALRLIDVLGTGQAGILWSFAADFESSGKLFFLDLTKGNKPYVLQEMNNNMGSLTRVTYGSSVYHYLRDEANALTRWKTDLPFPVQVVNRVEVYDFLSGGKLVTEYNYHNGYWDGLEREFRGFAHVDSTDTETFTQYNLPSDNVTLSGVEGVTYNQATVTPDHYTPPVQTKSWFYVGPVGDSGSRWHEPDFSNEYWNGDKNVLSRPKEMTELLASLPRPVRRAALRTLRGTLLRSELYALDGTVLQGKPYTVTESIMSLRMEFDPLVQTSPPAPLQGERGAEQFIFFPFNIAQRTTQYERGNDPMHNFSFTKTYDAYGQALGQLSIGVPRGVTPPGAIAYTGPFNGVPADYLATFTWSDFIYKDGAGGQYMVNRTKRSLSWDLTQSSLNKTVFSIRDDIFSQSDAANILDIIFPVIACSLSFYDGNAFDGLAYGQIGDYGAQVRSESLIITDEIIAAAYGLDTPQCFVSGTPDWGTGNGYPTAFEGLMQDSTGRMGYKDKTSATAEYVPGWYAESARVKYDFQDNTLDPGEQLGRVFESRDVFDAWSSIDYDAYLMMPLASTQYLYTYGGSGDSLVSSAEYDYRVMQPGKVTDVNENISVFDFSPLGLLRATAVIGKGNEGDYKSGSGTYYERYVPSVRMEYDFFAFKTAGDPVWVKTISREQHYVDFPLDDSTIVKVEYSDGFGRLLQTRAQAEDVIFGPSTGSGTKFGSSGLPANQSDPNAPALGIERDPSDPLNVVVSGWKIYNNKGKVVVQYEPFFDKGFDFAGPEALEGPGTNGQRIRMFYDSLGRVIRTVNPDNSQQWALYGIPANLLTPPDPVTLSGVEALIPTPWINFAYDANDLASLTNPTGSNVPSSHHFTPKSTLTDVLGRTLTTVEYFDNSNYSNTIEMNYRYDIRGNLLLVKDPYNRNVFEHLYDLRTPEKDKPLPPLWTKHIDKGESTVLFDAPGKPIESHDAKGAMGLSNYDVISRPVNSWAKNNSSFSDCTLRNHIIYGETATTPLAYNLKGKAYQSYDEAGLVTTPLYDFKGNLITKIRNVIDSAELKTALSTYDNYVIDWTGLPSILDATDYQSDMAYDALNRLTELELPQDLDSERKKIIPTYNTAGALEKVDLYSPTGPSTTNYVENIAYNAKGQRLLIAFGNNRMTRYAYDNKTFRLLRQRTEGYSKSVVGDVVTYAYTGGTNKQDDGFNYDLVGNIVNIFVRVTDCGIGGTPDALDRTFEYDPIYRLTYADGRESDTQSGNNYLYDDAPAPSTPLPSNVNYYERNYDYDKLGNVLSVVQTGTNGFTRDYTYNSGKNTLQKIEDATPATIESYTYDNCGNTLTTNLNRYYIWNHTDQLLCYKNQAGITPSVFTQYDYAGQDRVSKLVRTGNDYERTIYIDGIFEYVKLETLSTTYEKNYIHIIDDKSRIAEVRINTGTAFPGDITDDVVYILEDQIGSSAVRLNISGTIIDEEEYYPFGDSSLRTFTYKRYRYVGKEKDAESGLYYYGARYYAAWTCRFISVDPLAAEYAYLTPYNYAGNKPIGDFDIDGMQSTGDPKLSAVSTGSSGNVAQGNVASSGSASSSGGSATPSISISAVSTGASGSSPSIAGAAKVAKETEKREWNAKMSEPLVKAGKIQTPKAETEKIESASEQGKSKTFWGIVGLIGTLALAATGVGAGMLLFSAAYSADLVGAGVTQTMTNTEQQPLFLRGTTAVGRDILGLNEEAAKVFGNVTYGGLGLIAGGALKGTSATANIAAKSETFASGTFSVFDWQGYPAGGIKPTGTYRLLEGAEYTSARSLANSTNASMRRANPEMFKGLQIHEIKPVKFGGSPTDLSNKIFLTPTQHSQYTNFWNALMRSNK